MGQTRPHTLTIALLAPLLALLLGAGNAGAQEKSGSSDTQAHPVVVRGMITGVTTGSVRILSQTGGVTAALTSSTHVVRVVTGTTADLIPNAHVTFHLVGGTSTVDAVQIDCIQPGTHHNGRGRMLSGTPFETHMSRRTGTPGPAFDAQYEQKGAISHVSGQVVKVSGRTVTIRGPHGQTATYMLMSSAPITKWMSGRCRDLAIGVEVQAAIAGNKALSITILNG